MTNYSSRYASSPQAVKQYDTKQLRDEFLIDNLMQENEITFTYSHYDRYITGSAVPVSGDLTLETIDPLKSSYFLDRREMGVINVGGNGSPYCKSNDHWKCSYYLPIANGND